MFVKNKELASTFRLKNGRDGSDNTIGEEDPLVKAEPSLSNMVVIQEDRALTQTYLLKTNSSINNEK